MHMRNFTALALALAVTAGCAGHGGAASAPVPAARQWPVSTREYTDLWLHGYALLTSDVSTVPVFRRGYRDSVDAVRKRQNVLTGLDANHARLTELMAQNPEISNGQFLPLYFDSWNTMTAAITAFVRADPSAPPREPALRQQFAILGSMFPTVQDREWLRLFTQALQDESDHFYHAYWAAQQAARAGVPDAVDSLLDAVRPRLRRFLSTTHQVNGEVVLSLVLGGEGRTLNAGPDHNVVVVNMPPTRAAAEDAIFGFVHEMVQTIASAAVDDHASPADQRSGVAAANQPIAAVRAGAILLQRTVPELAPGYMRFYLDQAGVTAPAGDPSTAFTAKFQLPTAVVVALDRQVATALGGI